MKNTFNSGNELWTEIVLSGGWIEVLAGADNLSAGEQTRLTAIKTFGVANNYIRRHHVNTFVYMLEQMMKRWPGTTD